MVRPKENLVFNYFTYIKSDKKSRCNTCGAMLLGSHSGNLATHLKTHKDVYDVYRRAESQRKRPSVGGGKPTPPPSAGAVGTPTTTTSAFGGGVPTPSDDDDGGKRRILHSIFGPTKRATSEEGDTSPTSFIEILENGEENQVPDLSDRMGLDGAAPPPQHGTKMEGAASNYQVTCSPLISAMHEDFLLAGAAGPSHDAPSDGEHHHRHHHGGDYEHEDTIDVKAEPLFNVSPEICEDENSQNNTESSSERPSSQSSPTPGMAGPYLLKKETHCTTILDQLLRDDTFSDVTLTAEGQSIRAHKIVLCLASAYFRQVLSKESTVQNVIVFRDIKFSELKNLINFIYTGEATVDAAELESFMKTAEMLEVTSLCDGQRSIPRNFLPRYREPEMTPPDKPRTGASKRAHQSSLHSPPSKSRRVNEGASSAPPPSKHSRATTSQPSTSAAALPLSAIKSEPVSVDDTDGEDVDLFRTRVHYDDHDNNDDGGGATTTSTYDHRAKSPSQYQDMDQSPPVERRANSPDKVVPGKCPFCPPSQPQLRQGLALTKHLVTSHPEQPCAPCDACSRVFLTKAAFHAHKHDCNR